MVNNGLNSKQSVSSIVFRMYCNLAKGVISVRRKPALLSKWMFIRLDY